MPMTETHNTQAPARLQAYGPPKVLDLFSGIGGFSLGLERAGMKTVAFCEIEPFPRAVLAKHWPGVPCYEDVRTLTAKRLAADGVGSIDVICGGFPCQDISLAGKGGGLQGERSGLWVQFSRIVDELRPRFVIIENVSALITRGLQTVLQDLSALGYDAEWHCIPASYVGSPQGRDRIWIVAHAEGSSRFKQADEKHSCSSGWEGWGRFVGSSKKSRGAWSAEPSVGRVAHGLPHKLAEDELAALGNAVVPQIPEMIGRAIMGANN